MTSIIQDRRKRIRKVAQKQSGYSRIQGTGGCLTGTYGAAAVVRWERRKITELNISLPSTLREMKLKRQPVQYFNLGRIGGFHSYFNPFTTGNPFLGTKLLGFSIERGSGALNGLRAWKIVHIVV